MGGKAEAVREYLRLRREFLECCRLPQSVERDERLVDLLVLIREQTYALTGGGTPVTSR